MSTNVYNPSKLAPQPPSNSYSNSSGSGSTVGSSPYQRGFRHAPNRPAAPSGENWEDSARVSLIDGGGGGGGGGGSGLSTRSGAASSVSRRGVEDRV